MLKRSSRTIIVISLLLAISGCRRAFHQETPKLSGSVRNSVAMQLMVAEENTQPTLRIVLPGHPTSDRAIEILFPEHLTIRPRGSTDANQVYLFQPGQFGERPLWRRSERSLEYERNFPGAVHMLARATLEEDGVRFHFSLRNQSDMTYDLIWAPIDPRLTSVFHDVRLERTYVHHADGFDLLASEAPSRLTMPLSQWLPARYLASFTWPVPTQRIERRDDGIRTTTNPERSTCPSSPRFPKTVAGWLRVSPVTQATCGATRS